MDPYFFQDENVYGENYKNMLIRYALPRLVSLRPDYNFQQDGARSHSYSRTKAYLNRKRPNNWMGQGGPVLWTRDLPL